MSLSKPQNDSLPNPCTRWFEWNGEMGLVRYYDKDKETNVDLSLPFVFIVLDELAVIKGWHDASDSGITSNEVRDTTRDPLVVKAFKGGQIANGLYPQIREKIIAAGGYYTRSVYIAYPVAGGGIALGNIKFKGGALNSWIEFTRANKAALTKGGVKIASFVEGQKGKIKFRNPVFALNSVKPETMEAATRLDEGLQEFLDGYFKRHGTEQVKTTAVAETGAAPENGDHDDGPPEAAMTGAQRAKAAAGEDAPPDDDNVPF